MTTQRPPGRQYQAAPGWYADPSGAAWLRYFDGYRWTHHVHAAAEIHQPELQPEAAVVSPTPKDQPPPATVAAGLNPAPDVPDLDAMTGVEFENYVADLYRTRGFEAEVTRASGDFGADLIVAAKDGLRRSEWDPKAYDSDGWSNRMAVQCKRYSGAVGVSAVMAIIAAKGMYDCSRTAVVTNSVFTAQARELAEAHSVALIDGPRLRQMHQASLSGTVASWAEFPNHETCGVCYAASAFWYDESIWMCTNCAAAVGHRDSKEIVVKWSGNCPYCKAYLAVGDRARYGSSRGLGRGILYCLGDECNAAYLRYAEWAQNEVDKRYH
jgi:hypothetical protein